MHYPSLNPTNTFFSGTVRLIDVTVPSSVVLLGCQNWWGLEPHPPWPCSSCYYTVGAAHWNTSYRWEFWGHSGATNVGLCDGHVKSVPEGLDGAGLNSGAPHHDTWFVYKLYSSFYP